MTPYAFEVALKRLDSQWPRSYSDERQKLIYEAFKDVSDSVFKDAITECLMTCRGAPLMPELEKAVEIARGREKEAALNRNYGGSAYSVLQKASKHTSAHPETVKACMDALKYKLDKNPGEKEWSKICDYLDRIALENSKRGKETQ